MYWTFHITDGLKIFSKSAVSIGTNILVLGYELTGKNLRFDTEPVNIYVFDTVKMKWSNLKLSENQDWTCIPSMPPMSPSVVAHNSKIYLWGGRISKRIIGSTLFCFDTKTRLWTKPQEYGAIPSPRICHTANVVKDCMYINGGLPHDTGDSYNNILKLNLITMRWDVVITMGNSPSILPHSVTAIEDKLYAYSDEFNPENRTNNLILYILDTTSNQWICPTFDGFSPPIRPVHHISFSHNGFLYIFNRSEDKNPTTEFKKLYRYDPKTSIWMTIFPKGIPPIDKNRTMCTVINDRVFISGGHILDSSDNSKIFNDLHVLDLNPNLYTISLVNAKHYLQDKEIKIENLRVPLNLKRDLGVVSFQKLQSKEKKRKI